MNNGLAIVAQIEILLGELKEALGAKPLKPARSADVKRASNTFYGMAASINNLVDDGFFNEGKTIGEIQAKLRLEGSMVPTTSLSSPLLILVRKKILSRSKPEGGKGVFRYQRR